MGLLKDVRERIVEAKTPKCPNRLVEILLGIVNLIFFGFGTLIATCVSGCDEGADIVIGLLQLFVPFVGWIWSFIWGILMIIGRGKH